MNRSPKSSRRRMFEWMLILVGGPIFLWLFLRWFEQKNVFQPTRSWWGSGADIGRPWEDVRFSTRDGVELSAWYFPAATHAPYRDLAVLVSHGNGGNISHRLPLYTLLLDAGVNVLTYDYRGYGRSEGRPNEQGTYLDAEAAAAWLATRGFAPNRIIALGESLGGGVSIELARRHPELCGVILQSTFTSLLDLGAELFPILPVRTIARYHYDNLAKLPHLQVPVLFLHSREDTLIPFHHAERNFAVAREPKFLREIAGDHNDQPLVSPELYSAALREFLSAPELKPGPKP